MLIGLLFDYATKHTKRLFTSINNRSGETSFWIDYGNWIIIIISFILFKFNIISHKPSLAHWALNTVVKDKHVIIIKIHLVLVGFCVNWACEILVKMEGAHLKKSKVDKLKLCQVDIYLLAQDILLWATI